MTTIENKEEEKSEIENKEIENKVPISFKDRMLQLKEEAIKLKDKAIELKDKAIESWAKKLTESKFTISTKEELEEIIESSRTTMFTSKETWKTKKYKHKALVLFWEKGSDFFEKALYILPVIVTKAYTQNIKVKLAKSDIEGVELSSYWVKELPSLVVFEEKKLLKVIVWEKNILKLVKSTDLDINKQIDSI